VPTVSSAGSAAAAPRCPGARPKARSAIAGTHSSMAGSIGAGRLTAASGIPHAVRRRTGGPKKRMNMNRIVAAAARVDPLVPGIDLPCVLIYAIYLTVKAVVMIGG
jgi:hypothetical protein